MIRNTLVTLSFVLLMCAAHAQAQWGQIVRLSETDSASSATGIDRPLLAFGSTVLASWFDFLSGDPSLVCRRSTDHGANWGGVFRLASFRPSRVQFALGSGNTVLVAYDSAYFTFVRRSADGGANWSSADTLASSSGGLLALNPDGYAQFVWKSSDTIYWRRSTNNGTDWSGKAPLRRAGWGTSGLYALVTEGSSYAYVVFGSSDTLLVSRTSDNGAQWDPAQRIVTASSISSVFAKAGQPGPRPHPLV